MIRLRIAGWLFELANKIVPKHHPEGIIIMWTVYWWRKKLAEHRRPKQ